MVNLGHVSVQLMECESNIYACFTSCLVFRVLREISNSSAAKFSTMFSGFIGAFSLKTGTQVDESDEYESKQ